MAFPRPEDYKTYEGPRGSPADWSRKAKRVALRATEDTEVAAALKTLGLSSKPTPAELKKAFKQAALKAHPDQGGTNELFHEIQKALEILQAKL